MQSALQKYCICPPLFNINGKSKKLYLTAMIKVEIEGVHDNENLLNLCVNHKVWTVYPTQFDRKDIHCRRSARTPRVQTLFFMQGCSTKALHLCYIYLKYQNLGKILKINTTKISGSKLRSIGFMIMKTCWFLCISPVSSSKATLQKYCAYPISI